MRERVEGGEERARGQALADTERLDRGRASWRGDSEEADTEYKASQDCVRHGSQEARTP